MRLYEVLSSIKNKDDIAKLFEDLCTYQEIENMEQRLQCAKLLLSGSTYSQVIEQTDVSSATLSRVSRCIRHGSGGYSQVLKQVLEDNDSL